MPSAGTTARRPVDSFVPVPNVSWDPGFPLPRGHSSAEVCLQGFGVEFPTGQNSAEQSFRASLACSRQDEGFPIACLSALSPTRSSPTWC